MPAACATGNSTSQRAPARRLRLAAGRAALAADFLARPDATRYLHRHRRLIDATLRDLWVEARLPRGLALVAVGGYGRGDQYPHSDVDLLILLPAPADPTLEHALERFVGQLWDLGLEIGHSVRTLAQCIETAARDITVQTALLEARLLCGSRVVFDALRAAHRAHLDARAFFHAKRLEQTQRHAKYNDSPYSLEPHLKEAPGGLRDLQVIRWVASAAGLGHDWLDLAARELVTPTEARRLQNRERDLKGLRIRLHLLAARREERVLFDHQDALARQYRYADTPGRRASEAFMQHYYRTAKAVTQINTLLMQNFEAMLFPERRNAVVPLNARFRRVGNLLEARDADLFEREPHAILESFLLLQQHPDLQDMSAATLRALWRARGCIDARFRRDPVHRAQFLAILQQPRGIVRTLRRMNQYDILGRYLPAFGHIVGQMQHDLFHVHTVDQHILMVVRNLRRFTLPAHAEESPACSALMARFERHWLLYVAALFHDIAKGRGGDHSRLGRIEAARFCRAHGLAAADRELVEFLVEHHLSLSNVAQKRDLSDPEVVREFAATVRTERRLIGLYLLTVADIRGTSPKVWNAWKGKLLEDLFVATRQLLVGEHGAFDRDAHARRAEAQRLLRLQAFGEGLADALWVQLDAGYFQRSDPQDIAWHARSLHTHVHAARPIVQARPSPQGVGVQVLVYGRDEPELFARCCGHFESIGHTIVDARIHTTRHGYVLCSFVVLGADPAHAYRDVINLIEYELAARLQHHRVLAPPRRGRVSRQSRHFPIAPEVRIAADENHPDHHVLTIIAGDRPGLLHAIARVLSRHAIGLHAARIVTLGERAEDVFVVSGAALRDPANSAALRDALLEALR